MCRDEGVQGDRVGSLGGCQLTGCRRKDIRYMLGYGAVAVGCRAVVAQVRESRLILVSWDDLPGVLVVAEM